MGVRVEETTLLILLKEGVSAKFPLATSLAWPGKKYKNEHNNRANTTTTPSKKWHYFSEGELVCTYANNSTNHGSPQSMKDPLNLIGRCVTNWRLREVASKQENLFHRVKTHNRMKKRRQEKHLRAWFQASRKFVASDTTNLVLTKRIRAKIVDYPCHPSWWPVICFHDGECSTSCHDRKLAWTDVQCHRVISTLVSSANLDNILTTL